MYQIRATLGVGEIFKSEQNIRYVVSSLSDLAVIIDHFDKYPLITQKLADYLLFKKGVDLIKEKEHLTMEGLRKIVAIKASMNWGLSYELQSFFCKARGIISISRPLVNNSIVPDSDWLAGFTTGEGCFYINFSRSSNYRTGFNVHLLFTMSQHIRDEQLMRSLIEYLGSCFAGKIYKRDKSVDFIIGKFNDLSEKLIPFFKNHTILGVKFLDYLDFMQAIEIINNKSHLTEEGLDRIRLIKARMNKERKFSITMEETKEIMQEDGLYCLAAKEDVPISASLPSEATKYTKLKISTNFVRGNPMNIYEKSSEGFKLIGSFVSARRAGLFLGMSGNTINKYKNSPKGGDI